MDEYLKTKEIASLLRVKLITVRRWIGSGKLPAILLGREFRIVKSDFDKFLAERQVIAPRRKK